MSVLSNVEFNSLTANQSARLKTIAVKRLEKDQSGFLTIADINEYIKICQYSGDKKSTQWLKNLLSLHKGGKLNRIRKGATTYQDHVEDVRMLHAAGNIPFDIGDSVRCNKSGKYGTVIDYIPDTKEYLVVLNPFQMKTYSKGDITKVAQFEQDNWAQEEVERWVLNDEGLYTTARSIVSGGGTEFEIAEWLEDTFTTEPMLSNARFDQNDIDSIDWAATARAVMLDVEE